ncbi:hypothetical protein HK102_005510 [Quaeritorhiza haematococci]|nr:hypothetical protein HK102_005510 [Quaeritorhiza haematococci]
MLNTRLRVGLLILAACLLLSEGSTASTDADGVKRRHDYFYAVKKPFYFHHDNHTIPYFETKGNVIRTNDYVRLTPSVPSQWGMMWSQRANTHKEWEVEFSFTAFGRSYMGGQGLAFWYTKERMEEGPVYGNRDFWNGLGILFDTADATENRYTPYIYGVLNDGSKTLKDQRNYIHHAFGGCFRDYRNTPGPVWIRVVYAKQQLKVEVDLRQNGKAFTECFSVDSVNLPTGYYFGVSASTEQHLADDHDLYSFEAYEVNPKPRTDLPDRPHEQEFKAKGEEYHLTEEAKKKIQQVEKKVEEVRHEDVAQQEGEEAVNVHSIRKLQENQFKIIEALNIIERKIGEKPIPNAFDSSSGSSGVDSSHIEALSSKLQSLTDDVRTLTNSIQSVSQRLSNIDRLASSLQTSQQEAARKLEGSLASLHGKADVSQQMLKRSASDQQEAAAASIPSGHHYLMYLFAFLAGSALMFAYSAYRRGREERSKKFI